MNVAVHAGHAVRGSRGATWYMDEVKKNRLLKKYMIKYLKQKKVTVKDLSIHYGTQSKVLTGIKDNFAKKCKKGAWLNVSLHLNYSPSAKANGFEIWVHPDVYKDKQKLMNLNALCEEVCERTGFTNRGVKKTSCLYVLNNLPNCILFEVGFVTSKKDCSIYENKHSKGIACVIADCLLKYGKELL